MAADSPFRVTTPQSCTASASGNANSPMKVIPSLSGLPDIEYPSPVSVRNTFLDTDIGRPPSLDDFYQERLLQSAPGSAAFQPSKVFDSQVDEEPEFIPSNEKQHIGRDQGITSWPRTMSGEVLEDFIAAGVVCVTDIKGQSPSAKEMPPPPPSRNAPEFVAADLPPLPGMGYASDLPVPVKLAQVLMGDEPEVGTPEVPTMGSRNHRLGTCRPCAFFHTKGCSSGADCEFCHLCDSGEKKRRAKQRAVLRKGLELQEAPQPLAVGLVTASRHAAPGAMPAMLPGMATYAPMLPLPGMPHMWPPPL